MTAFPSYSTGTVAIGANSTVVVGTGSNWTGQNAMAGDTLVVAGFGPVVISDATDATHLAIDAWPFGAVAAGTAYSVKKNSPLRFVGAQTAVAVDQMVTAINTNGFYVFVGPDDTAPDPSLGDDNQYALQATTGKIWEKVGGVWTFVATYKGFTLPTAWNSATAYNPFDVVTFEGTSYVCVAANTNQEPSFGDSPPNAYWTVLAEKGEKGDQGIQGASYGGTSTTSLTIGAGAKAFTTQAGLAYTNGARVRASSAADTTNWIEGLATYSGTTLTINVTKTNGSGTHADWNLNVVGEPGAGDLSSTNNLSDVANAATALANLGGMAKSANLSDVANAATALANLGALFPPQGRLTLASATPVMNTTQSGKTTLYYSPYIGNIIPIYNGSKLVANAFSELSVSTTDTTKNPSAIGASKINDWFVWNDAGTLRLSHGPDWTNDTTRSAGTALVNVSGIWLNNADITNGPAASRGTYVGTTRSNASSTLDWIIGGAASGGQAAFLWVWNAYNRVMTSAIVTDSGASYTYSGGYQASGGGAGNRVNLLRGLIEDGISASYSARATIIANGTGGWSFNYDATTGPAVAAFTFNNSTVNNITIGGASAGAIQLGLGNHFITAVEFSDGANLHTFNQTSNNTLSVTTRM